MVESKVERLRVAGSVAPKVRKGNARRIAVVDSVGNVVGYRTLGDVQKSILERSKIEFDVDAPHRRKRSVCRTCGRLFDVSKMDRSGKHCPGGCLAKCVDCDGERRVYYKRFTEYRCKSCAGKLVSAGRTKESFAKASQTLRKTIARMSDEKLSSMTRGLKKQERTRPAPVCCLCSGRIPANAMAPSVVRKRRGKPPRCKACRRATGSRWDGAVSGAETNP